MDNNTPITYTSATQKRIDILKQIKQRASEKGDFEFFSKVCQDIRELEKQIKEYEKIR